MEAAAEVDQAVALFEDLDVLQFQQQHRVGADLLDLGDASGLLQATLAMTRNATLGLAVEPESCAQAALLALSNLLASGLFAAPSIRRRQLAAQSEPTLSHDDAWEALRGSVLAVNKLLALDLVPGESPVDITSPAIYLRTQARVTASQLATQLPS